jgi:hypothetical protein
MHMAGGGCTGGGGGMHVHPVHPPWVRPWLNGLKLVCNVIIVYGNLKSENSLKIMPRNLN